MKTHFIYLIFMAIVFAVTMSSCNPHDDDLLEEWEFNYEIPRCFD